MIGRIFGLLVPPPVVDVTPHMGPPALPYKDPTHRNIPFRWFMETAQSQWGEGDEEKNSMRLLPVGR
jgi:hypothetical protein